MERDSERAIERERERERERESPNTKIRQKQITPTIFPFVDSGPISLGFSRESPAADTWYCVAYVYNGELVPLIGNQRVGIFPPKSKILFVLSLALIWCRNFPGSDPSCRRRYVNKLLAERKKKKKKNKEISAFWAVFPVKYLRNGKRYSSSVFTMAKCNSRATKRCKRRYCRSYRFWDMKSSTSELRNADLYERAKSIPVRMNSHG